ncbi:MAG: peptidoglycan DD-metalloendopeptidase family protein [Selenomonadaceae bacterium]|nr:peptidoglycan DD-metalloendopeptidase family protein [Selenomonadaceae bacterium]
MEYEFKITSSNGSIHKINLSKNLAIYGMVSLAAFILLFGASFAYAAYSFFTIQNQRSEIEELKSVNALQQEQILNVAKKASSLEKRSSELKSVENELRVLSGIATPAEEAEHSESKDKKDENQGEGGAFGSELEHLNAFLDSKEKNFAFHEEQLTELRGKIQDKLPHLGAFKMASYNGGVPFAGPAVAIPSIWPSSGVVTSPYGYRWGGTDFHPGIDIADDLGTPIVATADGVVDYAGWNAYGYGNMVDIVHDSGIVTRYAHAMQVVVTPGQRVRAGQLIAYMGSTGFSTGPHVHYEVRIGGQAVNPSAYLH